MELTAYLWFKAASRAALTGCQKNAVLPWKILAITMAGPLAFAGAGTARAPPPVHPHSGYRFLPLPPSPGVGITGAPPPVARLRTRSRQEPQPRTQPESQWGETRRGVHIFRTGGAHSAMPCGWMAPLNPTWPPELIHLASGTHPTWVPGIPPVPAVEPGLHSDDGGYHCTPLPTTHIFHTAGNGNSSAPPFDPTTSPTHLRPSVWQGPAPRAKNNLGQEGRSHTS